jgi:uncharacterized protein
MNEPAIDSMISEFHAFIENKEFPCIGAKAAQAKQQLRCMVADHMACPKDDQAILNFVYRFISEYRQSNEIYQSAAVLFRQPEIYNEKMFEDLLWKRLQDMADLDARKNKYDHRVDADPSSPHFSYSIGEEAFYVVGLNPLSSRPARRFRFPAIVLNPHAQFEKLKESDKYANIQNVVRKRDIALSGSVNPMLKDFGMASEAGQYSGLMHDDEWRCPFNTKNFINPPPDDHAKPDA